MRVLLTHDRFPPDIRGGGEIVVLQTARGLMARGVDVEVLTAGDPADTEHAGVAVTRLPIHPYRMNLSLAAIAGRARHADIVQTFTYHAAIPSLAAGWLVRRPVVCSVLGLFGAAWRDLKGDRLGPACERWERFVLTRRYDWMAFLSEFSRQEGIAMGVDATRTSVTSPGVELERYRADGPKEPVVLFVGKLETRKGLDDLLAAARVLPEIPFRLVGWGEGQARVRGAALANVELVEFESGAPLREQLARASIFVFPSHAETFGIALVEAMASGCAVASSVPLEFAGERFAVGDREALVRALRALWSDPGRVTELGRRNATLARQYHWDAYVDRLLDAYGHVLRARGSTVQIPEH
ncbi:MAG: glycosyltransferase family 4 protein [Ectothiorhodospiraceae bacterium]|nr:glycosyltransferase family 4 protein [Ectothiorhodospiraceae bacterium]